MKFKRPNHVTVVAYLALFAALATGGAYAAGKIGSGDIAKNAVKSKHIGKGQVKAADIRTGAVKPRAIAWVFGGADPEFDSQVPKRGFTQVTSGATGAYCLTPSAASGLDPESDPPIITIEYGHSSGNSFTSEWDQGVGDCPDGTYQINTNASDTTNATNDAAFVVIVP